MSIDKRIKLFIVLAAVFCTCLVVGDIIGGKLVETSLFGRIFRVTVGMIPFPVTFLLTDVLNEFYGKRAARFVTLLGFAMAALAYAFIYVAAAIPIAPMTRQPGWDGVVGESFDNVFLSSQRMIVASLTAYLVAQFVDIGVFHMLKRATGKRLLWLRATGSTAISQGIDTITISLVAWWGLMDRAALLNLMLSSYVVKFAIAVGLTPGIYAMHALVERGFGLAPAALELPGRSGGE